MLRHELIIGGAAVAWPFLVPQRPADLDVAARTGAHSYLYNRLTLMHVPDKRSPLHGYDAGRIIEADARVFVTLEARDPTLAGHDVRYYAPQDIPFGSAVRKP